MLASESETAETLNNFFSNIIKKLNIPEFNLNNSVNENIKDPVFKTILEYKNHPCILPIQKYSKKKTFRLVKLSKTKALEKTIFPLELSRKILIYLQTF